MFRKLRIKLFGGEEEEELLETGFPEETGEEPDGEGERLSELETMRTRLVLSQISPHFLFNSLNAIYFLCEKDTKAAQTAITELSSYLRGNMDSVNASEPIPFETELQHIEHYLAIEKLRYGDELEIQYDINVRDFSVPALSVQALVENAVHHGIGKTENGGKISISSWPGYDTILVEVADNGVGFDPEEVAKDKTRSHTGIANTRSLLRALCGATLEIVSERGRGTRAMIRLPKSEI
ncbi:MAG: histidine kinase [Lachnospiraceae bacterium]|nr:histidine kinase [Lachnospiraceae bacterium]